MTKNTKRRICRALHPHMAASLAALLLSGWAGAQEQASEPTTASTAPAKAERPCEPQGMGPMMGGPRNQGMGMMQNPRHHQMMHQMMMQRMMAQRSMMMWPQNGGTGQRPTGVAEGSGSEHASHHPEQTAEIPAK